jgi:hypothetical protein
VSAAIAERPDQPVGAEEAYSWAGGYAPKVSAAAFKAAWDALAGELGHTPTAAELVTAARDEAHVLHGLFDWDVQRSAEARWIEQAQGLIRHLRVTYTRGPVANMPMRALFSVRVEGAPAYVPSATVLSNAWLRDQVMHQALRDVRGFVSKYAVFLAAIGADDQAAALAAAIEQATAA